MTTQPQQLSRPQLYALAITTGIVVANAGCPSVNGTYADDFNYTGVTLLNNYTANVVVYGDAAAAKSRLAALADAANQATIDLNEAELQWKAAQRAIKELENADVSQAAIESLRAALGELRADQSEKRSAYDRLQRDSQDRVNRCRTIAEEIETWGNRMDGTTSRLSDLEERRNAGQTMLTKLAARPAAITEQRVGLLSAITTTEVKRNGAADALAQGEITQKEADDALRSAERQLAESREQRVRCEALVEQAGSDCATIRERIAERLECMPGGVLQEAGIPAVLCGPGSIDQAHGANEYVETSQLKKCEDFLIKLSNWA